MASKTVFTRDMQRCSKLGRLSGVGGKVNRAPSYCLVSAPVAAAAATEAARWRQKPRGTDAECRRITYPF